MNSRFGRLNSRINLNTEEATPITNLDSEYPPSDHSKN